MKTGAALFFLIFACSSIVNCAHASGNTSVEHLLTGLPTTEEEFGLCSPRDQTAVAREWHYVLQYSHYDQNAGVSFLVVLFRLKGPDRFVLGLYDGKRTNMQQWKEASEEDKIRYAAVTKPIDLVSAQGLYDAWIRALSNARFGTSAGTVTDANDYYISAFAFDAGFMCASSIGYREGKTTGKIREVGLLLKSYLEDANPSAADRKMDAIRALCATVQRRE